MKVVKRTGWSYDEHGNPVYHYAEVEIQRTPPMNPRCPLPQNVLERPAEGFHDRESLGNAGPSSTRQTLSSGERVPCFCDRWPTLHWRGPTCPAEPDSTSAAKRRLRALRGSRGGSRGGK